MTRRRPTGPQVAAPGRTRPGNGGATESRKGVPRKGEGPGAPARASGADSQVDSADTLHQGDTPVNKPLPRFANGPANRWFGHLVNDDVAVPAADVQIYWNIEYIQNGNGEGYSPRVKDVAVLLLPRELLSGLEDKDTRHPVWGELRRSTRELRMSSGNSFGYWMTDDEEFKDDAHYNPDNLWRELTSEFGFLTDAEARRAREEFARIAECTWARDPEWPTPTAKPWTVEDDEYLVRQKRRDADAEERHRLNPPPPLRAIRLRDIRFPPSEEDEQRMAEGEAWRKREDELIAMQHARDLLG